MNISDEIKAKLDIVDVIRDYVQLRPAGTNFQALCPFHNEKSPSFLVSPDKQIWHCFGCGKGGDVLAFVMEKESLTFVECLRFLAPKAGVVLRTENHQAGSIKNRILDAMDLAADYYHKYLLAHPAAEAAREYLETRGLTKEVIEDWRIGYSAVSWDDLIIFLKAKGFSEKEIDAAGLASKGQGGNRFYNRFRGRIMFPIRDAAGQTVAFTARQLPGSDDKLGKYINSPSTLIYDKSKILFALDKSKNYIKESGTAVIVEGQMDAITAHQFGFKNTVASSGTALTSDQLLMLKRYAATIVLALDADQAGQQAAQRAGDLISDADQRFVEQQDRYGKLRQFIDTKLNRQVNIKIALVPFGKDPDEAIRKSAPKWEQAVEQAISLPQFYFERSMADLDLNSLEDRKKAAARFLPIVARLEPIEKDFWVRRLAMSIDTDAKYLYEALDKAKSALINKQNKPINETKISEKLKHEELLSRSLLALLLKFNAYIKYILDFIQVEQIFGTDYQSLYKQLVFYYNENNQPVINETGAFALKYKDFKDWLLKRGLSAEIKTLDQLSILAEKDYFAYSDVQAEADIKYLIKNLKQFWVNARRREISRLISALDPKTNPQASQEITNLVKELANLNEELRNLL